MFYKYSSGIKAEGVNQREDFVYGVQERIESVLHTELWQGMIGRWSANQFVPKQGEGRQTASGKCFPEDWLLGQGWQPGLVLGTCLQALQGWL